MSTHNTFWNGSTWVDITDSQQTIAANLIQQLQVSLGEAPLDSECGIPQAELVKSQGLALLYLNRIRDRFVKYFSDIIIIQTDDNSYQVVILATDGKNYSAVITA